VVKSLDFVGNPEHITLGGGLVLADGCD